MKEHEVRQNRIFLTLVFLRVSSWTVLIRISLPNEDAYPSLALLLAAA
jgi:hypothetical protein